MITKNQIKLIKGLKLKKNRVKEQLFVVEGEKVVDELLKSDFEVVSIFATKPWILKNKADVAEIIEVSNSDLSKISNLKSPNNVLALAKMKQKAFLNKNTGVTLVLDEINDPGNLGTIIRICDWFGVKKLICSSNTVDCYNAKVVQSAMGSLFRIDITYTSLEEYLSKVDTPIYGAFMNGKNIKTEKVPNNAHLIMGNEANGISKSVSKFIKNKVAIENIGGTTESLNVAVATSILLHEICN